MTYEPHKGYAHDLGTAKAGKTALRKILNFAHRTQLPHEKPSDILSDCKIRGYSCELADWKEMTADSFDSMLSHLRTDPGEIWDVMMSTSGYFAGKNKRDWVLIAPREHYIYGRNAVQCEAHKTLETAARIALLFPRSKKTRIYNKSDIWPGKVWHAHVRITAANFNV